MLSRQKVGKGKKGKLSIQRLNFPENFTDEQSSVVRTFDNLREIISTRLPIIHLVKRLETIFDKYVVVIGRREDRQNHSERSAKKQFTNHISIVDSYFNFSVIQY